MPEITPEIEALRLKALEGDKVAAAQYRAWSWNASASKEVAVTYEKSPLEGKVVLKTRGDAYVLGDEAVIELEHIGTALLSKIEYFNNSGTE